MEAVLKLLESKVIRGLQTSRLAKPISEENLSNQRNGSLYIQECDSHASKKIKGMEGAVAYLPFSILEKCLVNSSSVCYTYYINRSPIDVLLKTITRKVVMPKNTSSVDYNTLLSNLSFATKQRGGKNGDGKTCTMCLTLATPRFTVPKRFVLEGFRSGSATIQNGQPVIVLKKHEHNNTYAALHQKQHFVPIVDAAAAAALRKHHCWTIVDEVAGVDGVILFIKPKSKK